jgi:predicted aminopeptidase
MFTPMRSLFVALLACTAACSPIYVIRAGFEEAKILSRRRPIARVLEDPATDAETRRKLLLVLQARNFAEHALELNARESFTTFSRVDSDTLLLVVSAAYQDRFQAYTWWFPIVGHVPYKGFFNFEDAHEEARRLAAQGFDTYVRPSGAFSTLGWFNDPLLDTVLRYDDVSLVSTVIHEILHNTIYVPSQVGFNESFASFVGDRGAIVFFCERDGPDSPLCIQARNDWHDTLLFGRFLSEFVRELQALYDRTDLTSAQKIDMRTGVFNGARERFRRDVLPGLRTRSYRNFGSGTLNNATLIGVRLYYDRLDLFEQVFQRRGEKFLDAVRAIEQAARANPRDPFRAINALTAD